MKYITDLDECEGKKVKKVNLICRETVSIVFCDGTCVFIMEDHSSYAHSLQLHAVTEVDSYTKREAGIITDEEYLKHKKSEEMAEDYRIIQIEKDQLQRLKAKYEA